MHDLIELVRTLVSGPKLLALLQSVFQGWQIYAVLFAIVFAETGLLAGFFLPGDSLLFTIGVIAGAGGLDLVLINLLLIAAAVIGDAVGYFLGRRIGPAVFRRPDSMLFKQDYLRQTQAFYEKYGGKTIIIARFVPIVRTFAPFMAGVGNMGYGQFFLFNLVGGIGWVLTMTTLGYLLGGVPFVKQHFEKVVLFIIFVSILPMVVEILRARRPARV